MMKSTFGSDGQMKKNDIKAKTYRLANDSVEIVHIKPESIPRIEAEILSATILESVISFYKNPDNKAAYETWLANREKVQGENGKLSL